ncbi:hypothetical protein LTR37_003357 [Vermiconidia calcicola]|uniref:Uncharacterized protein n=1 Tax=Vermiconidia calcicola TaxID=1690605 RepID=A0ACC3NQ23_9PEZI|nr:hypothetical protein LTR37_003357 [Vermiconidia calcicola]
MVPVQERVAQQRYRKLVAQNSGGSSMFASQLPPRPRITYGKKGSKPLSLSGNQFKTSAYAIPSDEEEDRPDANALLQAAAQQVETDSEDSELSDAEPVLKRVVKHIETASRIRQKQGTTAVGTRTASNVSGSSGDDAAPAQVRKAKQTRNALQQDTTAPIRRSRESLAVRITKNRLTPQRRIPANELVLVTSPVDDGEIHDPPSSARGVQSQDPIVDTSSSPRKRSISPISSDDGDVKRRPSKAPLSIFKDRIKAPRSAFKSVADLRKKQARQVADSSGRDGFDDSELVVVTPRTQTRRVRQRKTQLIPQFGSLQLISGPLPDVEFEPSTGELKMETEQDGSVPAPISEDVGDARDAGIVAAESATHSSRRRVSFSSRIRDDIIRAQLSSISAPERVASDSEDSDDGIDEDLYDEGSEVLEDAEEIGSEKETLLNHDEEASAIQESNDHCVSLDFRRVQGPGQVPLSASLKRRALIEVNEAIIEVPDSDRVQQGHVLGRESILENTEHALQSALLNDRPQRQHRPHSILKNTTPMVPDSTTRPEETAANTRRNSVVDVSESRYFSDAINLLSAPDPARHKVVPRRRSSYCEHGFQEVEVPDTDRAIPETSPQSNDYVNFQDLNVLRRSSEAVWTSSLPRASKNLQALTRSVSREHGTLSQSVRRRPSMTFQSPTKVR